MCELSRLLVPLNFGINCHLINSHHLGTHLLSQSTMNPFEEHVKKGREGSKYCWLQFLNVAHQVCFEITSRRNEANLKPKDNTDSNHYELLLNVGEWNVRKVNVLFVVSVTQVLTV